MKNFNRGGNGGGDRGSRGGFGGGEFKRKSFGDRGSRGGFGGGDRPEMFKAICAECGSACEVPFKPNGNKPVLCSNCFKGSDRSDNRHDGHREERRFGDKQMFKATCDACGEECEVPFRPSGDKPVYCSNCFKRDDNAGTGNRSDSHRNDVHKADNSKLEERLEAINLKLEKILKLLNPISSQETPKDLEILAPKKGFKNDLKIALKDDNKVVKEAVKTVIKAEKKAVKEVKKLVKKAVKKTAKK
jgi:CxxC-x17-CxxC domain-containing protein